MSENPRLGRLTAGARAFNSRPATVHALRRLRRALPGDPGFGDPLSIAGRDSAATIARIADRLFDEEPTATQELGLGALQVWHSLLERTGRGSGVQPCTLLFTDLVGFSAWAARAGDDDALELLRTVASRLERSVLSNRGRVVKRLGDGLMAVFPSAQLAFDSVVEARERLADVEVAGYRPELRAGLHTGNPRAIGGDFVGVDVNVAARLAESANPGETLVSDAALAELDPTAISARRKLTYRLTRPKGVPSDISIYAVAPRE
ncbi:MAG TPA: adenylate/guanylate cyclase domain-containing protein [Mycobacteriales bacterium]|nr:adenylate/guanylate cyclase domain-containing protein [Mycobacteriales bacterium]